MNKINKLIRKTKINIILTILLVFISGVFCEKLDISFYEEYAKYTESASVISLSIESENGYILNVTDEPDKEEIETMKLEVSNDTYMNQYYQVGLKIANNCSYQNLNIQINKEQFALKDLLVSKDEEYSYFILGENEINATSDIYEIGLYIEEEYLEQYIEQEFLIDFVELSSMKA